MRNQILSEKLQPMGITLPMSIPESQGKTLGECIAWPSLIGLGLEGDRLSDGTPRALLPLLKLAGVGMDTQPDHGLMASLVWGIPLLAKTDTLGALCQRILALDVRGSELAAVLTLLHRSVAPASNDALVLCETVRVVFDRQLEAFQTEAGDYYAFLPACLNVLEQHGDPSLDGQRLCALLEHESGIMSMHIWSILLQPKWCTHPSMVQALATLKEDVGGWSLRLLQPLMTESSPAGFFRHLYHTIPKTQMLLSLHRILPWIPDLSALFEELVRFAHQEHDLDTSIALGWCLGICVERLGVHAASEMLASFLSLDRLAFPGFYAVLRALLRIAEPSEATGYLQSRLNSLRHSRSPEIVKSIRIVLGHLQGTELQTQDVLAYLRSAKTGFVQDLLEPHRAWPSRLQPLLQANLQPEQLLGLGCISDIDEWLRVGFLHQYLRKHTGSLSSVTVSSQRNSSAAIALGMAKVMYVRPERFAASPLAQLCACHWAPGLPLAEDVRNAIEIIATLYQKEQARVL